LTLDWRKFGPNLRVAALPKIGIPIAKFWPAKFEPLLGYPLNNVQIKAINLRQWHAKLAVASVAGLLLLAAPCALCALFDAGYWSKRMVIALAFLPL
jgi:hypothetical protein